MSTTTKLHGNARDQAGNKFRISPQEARTASDGTVLDSKLEKMFYEVLREALPGELRRQVSFVLQPSFRSTHSGAVSRDVRYNADFVLGPVGGTDDDPIPLPGSMIIDAKGMELPVFLLKQKMFSYKFRHVIRSLKTKKQLLSAIDEYKEFKKMNQLITQRAGDGLPFKVNGYRKSDGSVVNLTVRFLPPDGYFTLAKQSMEALDNLEDGDASADYAEAKQKVRDSLRKALGDRDTDENTTKRVSHETLVPVCDNVCLLNGHATHVVVFRLEVISTEVIQPPEKVSKSRNEVSAHKKRIEEQLPISRYCHRLNLYQDNYASIA